MMWPVNCFQGLVQQLPAPPTKKNEEKEKNESAPVLLIPFELAPSLLSHFGEQVIQSVLVWVSTILSFNWKARSDSLVY